MNDDKRARPDECETAEFDSFGQKVAKFYEIEPRIHVRIDMAGLSDPGKVRKNNEDQFLAVRRYRGREVLLTSMPREKLEAHEDHAYTLAVADGMGGRDFGELASQLALQTGWDLGAGEVKWTVKVNEREEEELRQKAQVSFNLINQAILDESHANPRLAGMGTTLTICYTTGPELFVMHAGDSRAYLLRAAKLTRLTHDHNIAQVLVDSGMAAPDSAEAKRMRHVLTNCLGGPDSGVQVDVHHHRLANDDVLMLCTDGLNDMIHDDEIARLMVEHPVPADACQVLVDLALERGGRDNITVLIGRYRFDA